MIIFYAAYYLARTSVDNDPRNFRLTDSAQVIKLEKQLYTAQDEIGHWKYEAEHYSNMYVTLTKHQVGLK